jgi:hypothetical protein
MRGDRLENARSRCCQGRLGAPAIIASDGVVNQNCGGDADQAQHALTDLQTGLDGAKRLVERTRFLLAGDALPEEGALIADAEAQAASPATSETVQNPSGE